MARRILALTAAATAASPAMAQDTGFDGLWRSNPTSECAYVEGAEDSALKVEDGTLYGVQTTCRMTEPVEVRDMDAILYDMSCEGEDGAFSERAMFLSAADGGLLLIWNGFAFKYESCADDAAVGTVATREEMGVPE